MLLQAEEGRERPEVARGYTGFQQGIRIMTTTQGQQGPVGQLVDGRYLVVGKIAEGGMASVYQARDQRLDRQVALKIMHAQLAQGPHAQEYIERFHREARSAAAVSNPHIVPVYDTGTYDGRSYLIMELIQGVTLRQELDSRKTFSVHETLVILTQILEGLAAAHEARVIHRDIKPENIMITRQGQIKITDFGLAKATSQKTLSATGMLLGTASYLAPEMIEDNISSPQSDLYSLGIVGWEMLTGHTPFSSANPVTVVFKHVHDDVPTLESVDPRIPHPVSEFIAFLVERDPRRRPENGFEALRQIRVVSHQVSPEQGAIRLSPKPAAASSSSPSSPSSPDPSSAPTTATPGRTGKPTIRQVPQKTKPSDLPSFLADSSPGEKTLPAPLPPVSPAERRTREENRIKALPQEKSKKKHHQALLLILAGILALCLATAGLAWFMVGPGSYYVLPYSPGASCVTDPASSNQTCSIRGIDFRAYKATLDQEGIPYQATYAFDDTIPAGRIVSANHEILGSHISKRRDSLKITVSKGVQMLTIPSDIATATSAHGKKPLETLKRLGFSRIIHSPSQDEYSLTVPRGAVISIDPKPGSRIKHNAPVTVVLSLGQKDVAMPSIIGLEWSQAQPMLAQARLQVTVKRVYSSNVAKDHVISASAQAGAQLHWNDKVTVAVSLGPQTVTVPDVTGMSYDDAKKKLEDLGFTVTRKTGFGLGDTVIGQSLESGTKVPVDQLDSDKGTIELTTGLFSFGF